MFERKTAYAFLRRQGKIRILDAVIAVFVLAYVLSFLFSQSPKAEAGTAGSISGYAWSENIGWVSFNCADPGTCAASNYAVNVDASGKLSGYGWSETIGWITANESELSGCPSNPCRAKINGNALTGWLRALSYGGGWDGWISLSGSNYGVTQAGETFSGYAWGSDVVGWLDFQYARTTYAQTCAVTDICTTTGGTGYLTHQNLDCSITTVRTCLYGCASSTACNPECTPSTVWSCSGAGNNTITRTDTSGQCVVTTTYPTVCESPAYCSAGSSVCLYPTPDFGDDGHLQLSPSLINTPQTIQVLWDVSNVETCSVTGTNGDGTGENDTGTWDNVTGNGRFWSGPQGKTSSIILAHTTYTLSCTGLDGSTVMESINVDVTPVFQEK